MALVAPATAWQAYNRWGGYSLYHGPDGDRRSYAVSFDRPYDQSPGANDYRSAAMPIVVRAEQLGIPLSYYTNVDLHTTPGLLEGAHGYVSMGHDEYWTTTMRSVVTEARDAGTNLAFLGANTMYWRVRLEDRPHRRGSRAGGLPARRTPGPDARPGATRGDVPVPGRPRRRPGGLLDRHAVRVLPGRRRLRRGDAGVVGVPGRGRRRRRLADPRPRRPEADRVYPSRRLPRPMQILSRTPYDCAGVPTVAESVYYTTASGAGVFTAGTLRWVRVGEPVQGPQPGDPDVRPPRHRHAPRGVRPRPGRASVTRRRTTSPRWRRPRSTRCRLVDVAAIGHHGLMADFAERRGWAATPSGAHPRARSGRRVHR